MATLVPMVHSLPCFQVKLDNMMAVETPTRMNSGLTGDQTMRDPGVFTVVYSRAPSPSWDIDCVESQQPVRRETETPRLPSINRKPPIPNREIRMLRGESGMERSSSQMDLRRANTRLPEAGKLNNGLSRSSTSVNKSAKPGGSPYQSPASIRRGLPGAGLDREATNMNTELHRRASDHSLEALDSPGTARQNTALTRGQDTSRTLHKSASVPHSLASKDSKLSSNSSYSTMASSRPNKKTSLTSRKLSVVSGSPASQRRQSTLKPSVSTGSLTSRTQNQLTVKTLKKSDSTRNLSQKITQSRDQDDYYEDVSPQWSDRLNCDGYPIRIPEGMSKDSFDICWNWVSSVEAARTDPDNKCFDMVMDSMVDWSDTNSAAAVSSNAS